VAHSPLEMIGDPSHLAFEIRWLGTEPPDVRGLGWGELTLWFRGTRVWSTTAGQGVQWTWIDLVEHLARGWAHLLYEEVAPYGLVAENPDELRKPDFLARVRRVPRSSVDSAVYAYQQRHDLAAGLKGIYLPSVWLLREGTEMRVRAGDQDLWRPLVDVSSILEETAEAILTRALHHPHVHARATSADARWKERLPSKSRLMTLRAGLDEQQLRDWAPQGKGIGWWGSPDAESPMMAVARMSRPLTEATRRLAIEAVAGVTARKTTVLDALTTGVGPVLEATSDRKPHEQGYALALWLRSELKITGRVDPGALLQGWKVHVEDLPGVDRQLDAFACWGNRGPAIFVNPQGEHANSTAGRRATLAHEIAHLILDRWRSLPLAEMFGGATPVHLEKRARAFAAELLLPREVASSAVAISTSLLAAARQLQDDYGVSREIVAWQISNGTGMDLLDKKQRAQVQAWAHHARQRSNRGVPRRKQRS
jgi:Zn-dependent peptidase ImmA (M78 family)